MQFNKDQIVEIPAWGSNCPVYCSVVYLLNELRKEKSQIDKDHTKRILTKIINSQYGTSLTEEQLIPFLQSQYDEHPMIATHLVADALFEQTELKKLPRHTSQLLLDDRVFEILGKLFHFNTKSYFNGSSANLADNGFQVADGNNQINLDENALQDFNLNHTAAMNIYYLGDARGKHLHFNLIVDSADKAFAKRFNESMGEAYSLKGEKSEERKPQFKARIEHFSPKQESKPSDEDSKQALAPSPSSSPSPSPSPSPTPSLSLTPLPAPSSPTSHSADIMISREPSERRLHAVVNPNPGRRAFTEPGQDCSFQSEYRYFSSEEKALDPNANQAPMAAERQVRLATHLFPKEAHNNEFNIKKFKILESNPTVKSLRSRLVFEKEVEALLEKKDNFDTLGDKEKNILLAMVDKQVRDGLGSLQGSGHLVISINNKSGAPMKPVLQQAYKNYCFAMGYTLKDLSQPEAGRTVTSRRITEHTVGAAEKAAKLKKTIEDYRETLKEKWTIEARVALVR